MCSGELDPLSRKERRMAMAQCETCGRETPIVVPSLLASGQVCLNCFEDEKILSQEWEKVEREILREQSQPVGISGSGKDGIHFYR
jgi:hypothetical protein